MTPVQISKTWAWGIYLGSSVYLGLATFLPFVQHPIGYGVWVGALFTMAAFWLQEK